MGKTSLKPMIHKKNIQLFRSGGRCDLQAAIAAILAQFAEKPNLKAGFLGQLKMDGLNPKITAHKTAIDDFFAEKGDFETVLTMVLKLEY